MKKSVHIIINSHLLIVVSIIFMLLNSCTDDCKELNRKINSCLNSDNDITKTEWNEIKELVITNKENLDDCYDKLFDKNDSLSNDKLLDYIKSLPLYKRNNPSIYCDFNEKEPIVIIPKIYLERSESMVNYDEGSAQFIDALQNLLNTFDTDILNQNLIYIVNDTINNYPNSISNFLRERDIFNATSHFGDPAWTDFHLIFTKILSNSDSNDLNILFSDLIYSVQNPTVWTKDRILVSAKNITTNLFRYFSNDYSFILLKLNSDYIGNYYCWDNTRFAYNGKRPYYICFIAKNYVIKTLMKDEKYQSLRDFESLPEFENYHIFYKIPKAETPYYSVLLGDRDNSTTVKPTRDALRLGQIKELENAKLDRSGNYKFKIAVDLSDVFLDDDFKCDTSNYEVDAFDTFKIEKIEKLVKSTLNAIEKRYANSSTHVLTISATQIKHKEQSLKITLLNKFPDWIKQSSTTDDTNRNESNFSETTFGLEYMMQGIYNAYYQAGKAELLSIEINFKN